MSYSENGNANFTMPVSPMYGGNGGFGNGFFGGDAAWWLIILLLFANNGWGNGFGFGGGMGSCDSPGTNTGVSCHFLLQGIFPTQGLNPDLLYPCRQILFLLSHKGSPFSV